MLKINYNNIKKIKIKFKNIYYNKIKNKSNLLAWKKLTQ